MNGKRAKRLRHMAQELTVGLPERDYRYFAPAGFQFHVEHPEPRTLTRIANRFRKAFGLAVVKPEPVENPSILVDKMTGEKKRSPICHHPNSVRSVYQRLKRARA